MPTRSSSFLEEASGRIWLPVFEGIDTSCTGVDVIVQVANKAGNSVSGKNTRNVIRFESSLDLASEETTYETLSV
jgi:hypothetical protein